MVNNFEYLLALAERIEEAKGDSISIDVQAAAELRRLVNTLNHVSKVRSLLVEQRDELLYALQQYLAHASEPECAIWRHIQQKARTAIAKATGE